MATGATISLKLLVDKTSSKVIFAEGGKDFVDFLFGLLEIPIGSLMMLLEGTSESWSLSKVYQSVKNLDDHYLQPGPTTQNVLFPNMPSSTKQNLLFPKMPSSNTNPLMQQLGYGKSNAAMFDNCTFNFSTSSTSFGAGNRNKEVSGYVEGSVTYLISDDLRVKPMSTISTITFINSLGVKDLATLEEKMVYIDRKKALKLVKTLFESNTVLTDVFVGKRSPTS